MPNSPESPRPSDEEMTNMQSEAADINKMVNEDLLAPEEASEFDYKKEIEVPEELSTPPKLSDRLRKHVLDKFPPESFQPEHIAGTLIHGTTIEAIRPLWLGEGIIRTEEGRRMSEADRHSGSGEFRVYGNWTRLDRDGFNYLKAGERSPEALPELQIFIVSEQSPVGREYEWQAAHGEANPKVVRGVVLSKADHLSVKHRLSEAQAFLEAFSKGEKAVSDFVIWGDNYRLWLQKEIYKAREEKIKSFIIPSEPQERAKVLDAFMDFLETQIKSLNRPSEVDERMGLNELVGKIARDELSTEQITQNQYFTEFLRKYLLNTLRPETEKILKVQIDKFLRLLAKYGQNLYAVGGREGDLYLTLQQETNYVAHCMVRGIDQSKIVPIYDWDGNLLWPKDNNTNDPPQSEKEGE